ncbi:hypothetical protein HYFRA_00000516 [Hymenoscyphus fraxineus]|uniref:Pectate lyase n=1 Tax=Hymenoscyphus fraxineus TaxID=746836 RepID=A0A9N9L0Z1_9HELO|nr:hypothetical protein HYFRA_00000516 [Hymenoscyphus fraxineus]
MALELDVSDITCINCGRFYRACENYDGGFARHVESNGITATNGKVLVGIIRTPGDTATNNNSKLTGVGASNTENAVKSYVSYTLFSAYTL